VWGPPPPNDAFADAAKIAGRSGRVRGSNIFASRETGEPRYGRSHTSVWYRWRAPRAGVLRLSTAGSGFDTLLSVYRGRRLRALRRLARNDDSGRAGTSAVRLKVHRGRVYRIAVDGYAGEMGAIVLRWTLATRRAR
jgi:hypothetical protein